MPDDALGPLTPAARRDASERIRIRAAETHEDTPAPAHHQNGDEARYAAQNYYAELQQGPAARSRNGGGRGRKLPIAASGARKRPSVGLRGDRPGRAHGPEQQADQSAGGPRIRSRRRRRPSGHDATLLYVPIGGIDRRDRGKLLACAVPRCAVRRLPLPSADCPGGRRSGPLRPVRRAQARRQRDAGHYLPGRHARRLGRPIPVAIHDPLYPLRRPTHFGADRVRLARHHRLHDRRGLVAGGAEWHGAHNRSDAALRPSVAP